MDERKKAGFEEMLFQYNEEHRSYPIRHVNTTFEALTEAIREVIEDRDYEMKDILDDYLDYCFKDGLITVLDSWKFMRMQLAGTTLDFNAENDVYYDNVERRFRAHDYLGLYKSKSVRLIGKICAQIVAVEAEEGLCCEAEIGEVTEERKEKILYAMKDAERYGYDLHTVKHRYFFVEKFYETDFRKISPKASMGTRIFDLSQLLNKDKEAMDEMSTETIAKLLEKETWV